MNNYFEFSSPEEHGIPSESIINYAKALTEKGVNLHSLLIIKDGVIVAEGYEKHWNKDSAQRMYSVSKTFVSAAVGCLIGEGKLAPDDEIYRFFADKFDGEPHPYLKETTVRDLLMMASPFDETSYSPSDKDWVKTFFNTVPSHRPGTVFNYDTSATLVLCALIERITGLDFTQYLYEKVLKFISFEKAPECVREPSGVQWGGSGVLCSSRELVAFALLFMNGGRNKDGVQLIPENYVKEAAKMQICNAQNDDCAAFRGQGYGYKIWMTKYGFAFLGMGNQLAVCVPSVNLLTVTTADDQGNPYARGYIFDLLEEMIINSITEASDKSGKPLCLDSYLKTPLPCRGVENTVQSEVNGKEFKILPNKHGFEKIRFTFGEEYSAVDFVRNGEAKCLRFGIGEYIDGTFPEIYSGKTINEPAASGYRCTAAAVWAESGKLVLRCYIIDDYLGNFTANISFKNGRLDIKSVKNAEWFLNEYEGYLSSAD